MPTTIILKNKNVAAAVPGVGDLVPGELAFNTVDLKLFCLSADGLSVTELIGNPADDNFTQYLINVPDSVDRNLVEPVGDFVALTIRGSAGHTASLQEWLDGADVVLSSVGADGTFTGPGSGLTDLNADNIASGLVGPTFLGTGTADATTFLAGDNTWQTIGAPSSGAAYVLNTADPGMPSAQVLALLATGMVKVTTLTGLLSTAVPGTDYLEPGVGGSLDITGDLTVGGDIAVGGDITIDGTVTVDALTGYIKGTAGLLSAQAAPIPPADLGTGIPSATTVLCGDGIWTAVAGMAGIPAATATYIVRLADASVPNAFALATLATGLLKVTTATGALSNAVAGTDYLLPNGDGSALTAISYTQILDFHTGVQLNRLDQMAVPTAAVSFGNQLLTNLANPSSATDAANKLYVDSMEQGIIILAPAQAASTGNEALTGVTVIDDVTLVDDDRVLLKAQTDPVENGVYVFTAGDLARAADELDSGSYIHVTGGTINGACGFVLSTPAPIIVDTTAQDWILFSSVVNPTPGLGITVNGSQISIDLTWPGQVAITTLGTITTGTWNATAIAAVHGGTGLTVVAVGDLLVGTAANTWSALPKGATDGEVLAMVAGAPAWSNTINGGTW